MRNYLPNSRDNNACDIKQVRIRWNDQIVYAATFAAMHFPGVVANSVSYVSNLKDHVVATPYQQLNYLLYTNPPHNTMKFANSYIPISVRSKAVSHALPMPSTNNIFLDKTLHNVKRMISSSSQLSNFFLQTLNLYPCLLI